MTLLRNKISRGEESLRVGRECVAVHSMGALSMGVHSGCGLSWLGVIGVDGQVSGVIR